MGADGGTFADEGGTGGFVGCGGPQAEQIGGRGARVPIVGEDGPGGDHDAVFEGHTSTNVDKGIDFDPMTDVDVVGDIGFFADEAFVADRGTMTDMDVVPDSGALTEAHPIFDESCWMDERIHSGDSAQCRSSTRVHRQLAIER